MDEELYAVIPTGQPLASLQASAGQTLTQDVQLRQGWAHQRCNGSRLVRSWPTLDHRPMSGLILHSPFATLNGHTPEDREDQKVLEPVLELDIMDPLSICASAVTLTQLAGSVCISFFSQARKRWADNASIMTSSHLHCAGSQRRPSTPSLTSRASVRKSRRSPDFSLPSIVPSATATTNNSSSNLRPL